MDAKKNPNRTLSLPSTVTDEAFTVTGRDGGPKNRRKNNVKKGRERRRVEGRGEEKGFLITWATDEIPYPEFFFREKISPETARPSIEKL